jgi:seryl-tRNA synthetase
MSTDKFVYKTLIRHEKEIRKMSQTIADLQHVVQQQGELIEAEHAEINEILEQQQQAIDALEEQLDTVGVADEAVKAEIDKIAAHNEAIQNMVTASVTPEPPEPIDPNAPVIDNTLPGPQPEIDNTLPS